mmetsp:Transcript_52412/g.140290  ORF Transcript_52412/g.140290 Transcript_52412/m.140290 type:complete len:227 (+) Transcript_52412:447-1127(+)
MSEKSFGRSKTGSRSRFPRTASHLCAVAFQWEPRYIRVTPVETLTLSNCSEKKPRSETPSSLSWSTTLCCTSGGMKPTRCTKPFCRTTMSRSAPSRSRSRTSSTSAGASAGHKSRRGGAEDAGRGGAAAAGAPGALPSATLPATLAAAGAADAVEGALGALAISGDVSVASPSEGMGQRTGCRPRCAAESCGLGKRQIMCSPPMRSGTTKRLGLRHQKMCSLPFSS